MALSHNLGFPRIGDRRQLKFALEAYWQGKSDQETLFSVAKAVKEANWRAEAKLDFLTAGDFSFYDHILDTSTLLGVIPPRFDQDENADVSLDTYFRIARGQAPTGKETYASEMTKWFDTNYHYIVPEIEKGQRFRIASQKLFDEVKEAVRFSETLAKEAQSTQSAKPVKAVIVGPVTWLYLAKVKGLAEGESFDKLTLLPELLATYGEILTELNHSGAAFIQIDEPILVLDLAQAWQDALLTAYEALAKKADNLILTTYFEGVTPNLSLLEKLPVAGIHLDGVIGDLSAAAKVWPAEKIFSAGVVNGRNIWANDLSASLTELESLAEKFGQNLWIAPSSSLLHVPVDLSQEEKLDEELTSWLAFALDKLDEVATLTAGINGGRESIAATLAKSDAVQASRRESTRIHNPDVIARVEAIGPQDDQRKTPFVERTKLQSESFQLPLFPTTTIGSFPQTGEIRALRRTFRAGETSKEKYISGIKAQIEHAIRTQEALGLDVLVHGEAERNDMVEYFGEHLNGFAFTQFAWVQSYGSRCVKPPIIYGDVSRPEAITVEWIQYAQSLTDRPVKGMLTGPVTILSWSFPREDESFEKSAYQIALALRDEVADLEAAGVQIIQIDEPAIRELLPLRKAEQADYLQWAERAFRLSAAVVKPETQIHTHMCYSEFNEIIHSIANLDADVITIETSRSDMALLDVFQEFEYPNDIGPGVYDIHSPRVPEVAEITHLIERATEFLPKERIWVNPDCGLKTRGWEETKAALKNMVEAAKVLRQSLSA